MTRVVIAEDHRSVREMLRAALEPAGFDVVGEAGNGEEAVRLTRELDPDVVLMDVTMPGLGGIDATELVLATCPEARIVIFTAHEDPELVAQAARAGAAGYVAKGRSLQHLYGTLRRVANGEVLLSRRWADAVVGQLDGEFERHSITRREREVLQLSAKGYTTAQTGERLFISPKTVRTHLSSVYEKLGVTNRTQALIVGAGLGLISLPSSVPSTSPSS
jgi:DNA-binding NarL/FixJ family response regulator